MIVPIKLAGEEIILDPIALLTEQLKEKTLKKQAIEQIGTIALTLNASRIRQGLVPLLIQTFIQENLQMRIAIVKSFGTIIQYLQSGTDCFVVLQFTLDVLCVFSEEQLRKEAYQALQMIVQSFNLKKYQDKVIKVIKQLSGQSEKNIRQLVLRLVRYVYAVADSQNQAFLLEVLNKYKQTEEDQLVLAQQLTEFIKIIPHFPKQQIHNSIKELLKSSSSKVRSRLIEPVILLTKILDESATSQYFQALLNDSSTDVIAALISQINKLKELPSKTVLNQLLKIIDNPQKHDSTVRAAILEVLQHITLTQQRRAYVLQSSSFKSLSLSKALADSLCKIHDIQALTYLIENSDTQFKNKLFPKLPPTCEIHVKLMEHIFNQKNWRSKLTLLQNIDKRMENKQNVQLFIPKLIQQLGDKIGVLRVSVVKLIASIMKGRKVELRGINSKLQQCLQSKNWFQKQSVLLLMEQLSSNYTLFDTKNKSIFKGIVNQGKSSSIQNIRRIAEDIIHNCRLID